MVIVEITEIPVIHTLCKIEKSVKKFNFDQISYTSIPITMHFSETKQKLASGTAFIYEFEEKFYLITNWHNVTGLNPITKEHIGNHRYT